MMLRGSVQQRGDEVDLQAIVAGTEVDSHVPGGEQLIELVEAALQHPETLDQARGNLSAALEFARTTFGSPSFRACEEPSSALSHEVSHVS